MFYDVERDNGPSCVFVCRAGASLQKVSPIRSTVRHHPLFCGVYNKCIMFQRCISRDTKVHDTDILHGDLCIYTSQ